MNCRRKHSNTSNTENMDNTDNTKKKKKKDEETEIKYVYGVRPLFPDLCYGVDSISYHMYGYDYDLTLERETPPRFKARVVIEDDGRLYIDRDNVYWYDDATDEEKNEIYAYLEDNKILDFMHEKKKD